MAGAFGDLLRGAGISKDYSISEFFGGNKESLQRQATKQNVNKMYSEYQQRPSTLGNTASRDVSGDYSNLLKTGNSSVEQNRNYALDLEKARQDQESADREKLLKRERKAYDPFFAELSRQEAEIPGIEQEYMGTVNSGYQNQADTINRGQQAGLAQADQAIGGIKQNQATSLRDLALNLGSAVQAFGQKLGAQGSGDSSAANMANYGFSKMANRNAADIQAQVRDNLAKVETAKQELVREAQDKLSTLETWKAQQTLAVSQYIRSLRDYVAKARSQGKQALASDEVESIRAGFERAQQRLQQINDLAVTSRSEILQNAQAALADAQAFGNQLNSMGNVEVDPVTGLPVEQGTIAANSGGLVYGQGSLEETDTQSPLSRLLGLSI